MLDELEKYKNIDRKNLMAKYEEFGYRFYHRLYGSDYMGYTSVSSQFEHNIDEKLEMYGEFRFIS